jgi:hypothetical protein
MQGPPGLEILICSARVDQRDKNKMEYRGTETREIDTHIP